MLDPALNPANDTRSGSIPNSFARLFTSRSARFPSSARALSSYRGFSRYVSTNAVVPQSLNFSATSIPSRLYISMMFDPPGAITTAEPFGFPTGRNTVKNGASNGPVPTAIGTFPASHRGML